MKYILTLFTIVIITILGLKVLSGSNLDSKLPVRIGLNQWPGYEFFYLAEKMGFYEKLGVNVDVVEYNSLEDVRHGFEKGQIDIMNSTIIEVLLSADRTNKLPNIFFATDFSNGGDVIISGPSIRDMKEIEQKTIAVEPNSLGMYMLVRALEVHGHDIKSVNIVGMTQHKMQAAIENGAVDAIVTYPPVSINVLRDNPSFKTIFSSSDIPGEIIDVVSCHKDFFTNNRDKIRKIIEAWDMAVAYHQTNPDEANAIMAKREKITPEEFSSALSEMKILTSVDQEKYFSRGSILIKALERSSKLFLDTGLISSHLIAEEMLPPLGKD